MKPEDGRWRMEDERWKMEVGGKGTERRSVAVTGYFTEQDNVDGASDSDCGKGARCKCVPERDHAQLYSSQDAAGVRMCPARGRIMRTHEDGGTGRKK